MTRVIEFLVGALLISVLGSHHAKQDDADLVLKHGSAERISHTVDQDELVHITNLNPGKDYFVHISSFTDQPEHIKHSKVRARSVDRTFPHISALPLSLSFRADDDDAWLRLFVDQQVELSFSVLKKTADKAPGRAAGIVPTPMSAQQLIEEVLIGGGCFDVTNISGIGPGAGRGSFSNGAGALGFPNGVMLTTGPIGTFTGPNSSTNTSNGMGGGGDPDLTTIAGAGTNDAVGIEFDFTPTVEEVTFTYAFGSEEYCEYTGTAFNDAFGFFLSGPGIGGPYTNGAINLAKIPGTNDNVTINSVNYSDNSGYYVNNAPPGSGGGGGGCVPGEIAAGGAVLDLIEFDGLTVPLQATVDVQPCETYHIKLVVADASDGIWDSGVFLEAGSFQAGGEAELEAYNTETQEEFAFEEDCLPGQLVITRQGGDVPLNQPLVLDLLINSNSTATEGVDFEELPDQVVIPANQTYVVIPINIINDDIVEGDETIILEFDFICSCDNPQTTFIIKEMPDLEATVPDVTVCENNSIQINSSASGGFVIQDYDYEWSNGASGPGINVAPGTNTSYQVTVTDFCGNTAVATSQVEVIPAPVAEIDSVYTICPGIEEVEVPVTITGTGPYTLTYAINGDVQPAQGGLSGNTTITMDEAGTIELVSVLGPAFCQGETIGQAEVEYRDVDIDYSTVGVTCPGTMDGEIQLNPVDFGDSLNIQWDVPVDSPMHPTGLSAGTYNVTIQDEYGCTQSTSIDVNPAPDALKDSISVVEPITCISNSASLELEIENGTPPYDIQWSTPVSDPYAPDSLSEGTYYVTITDSLDCVVMDSIYLGPPNPPQIKLENSDIVSCDSPEGRLEISVSDGQPPFNFLWSTGDTTAAIDGLTAGTYSVTVNDQNYCSRTDSFTITDVSTYPEFDFAPSDTLSCTLDSLSLNITNQQFNRDSVSLSWSTNNGSITAFSSDSTSAGINSPGTYILSVRDSVSGCIWTDSIQIEENTRAPDPVLSPSNVISCKYTNATIALNGDVDPSKDVANWFDSDMNVLATDQFTLQVSSTGWYIVELTDQQSGCSSMDSVYVDENFSQPTADAGPSDTLSCEVTETTIDGSASAGSNLVYQWSAIEGGALTGGTDQPIVQAGSNGLYILEVRDSVSGCSSRDTVEVFSDSDRPVINIEDSAPLTCETNSLTLDASNSTNGDSLVFSWSTFNGQIQSGQNTPRPTISSGGTYILELSNPLNGCTVYDSVLVEIDTTSPPLSIQQPDVLTCDISSVEVSVDGNTPPYLDYQWNTSDGQIVSSGDLPSITVNEPGTYTVEVLDTRNGCLSTQSIVVDENRTRPSADAGTDQLLPCDVNTITLSGSASGASDVAFAWSSPDGNIVSGSQSDQVEVNATGQYVLQVTNQNNGCSRFDTVEVYQEMPVDINLDTKPVTCNDLPGHVEILGIDGGNAPYQYSLDGSPFKNEAFFGDLDPGSYRLTVEDANGCTTEVEFTIAENDGPTLSVHPYYEITIGETRRLGFSTNIPESDIDSILWSPSNYLSCTNCPNPLAQPEDNITYTVTIIDEYGCMNEATIEFRVDKRPDVYIPNAFTPNNDGINDYFNVYGNAAVQEVERMEIFNRWGDRVYVGKNLSPNNQESGWDGRYRDQLMNPGVFVYVIEVRLIDGETYTFKGDVSLIR